MESVNQQSPAERKPWWFKPGQSGNPSGRRTKTEAVRLVEKLSKQQAQRAVEALMGPAIKRIERAIKSKDEQIALRAALTVLDRSLGMPTQRVDATITSNETVTMASPELLRAAALKLLAAQAVDVQAREVADAQD